jgi:hypothetical protein
VNFVGGASSGTSYHSPRDRKNGDKKMSKIDTTVGQLVDMIERGELRLPEMQRRYVWTSTRVRDLFDSLYRGYPSGTVLVWDTDAEQPARDLSVGQQASPFAQFKLLLDGQQRLTSLSAVIRGEPVNVRNRKRPIQIAFNLDHPEGSPEESEEVEDDTETLSDDGNDIPEDADDLEPGPEAGSVIDRINKRVFSVASKQLLRRSNWINVSDVFADGSSDWDFLQNLVDSPADPKYNLYSQRLQKLRQINKYPYVMQVLDRNLSYEEVTDIFVRVNSLGMKLRGSDLALAQITAKWQNSLPLFEGFSEECEENGFTIDVGLLVRLMVVFATKQSRFKTVTSIPLEVMQESWDKAKEGMRFALNFLRSNAGVENERLLASPMLIIPISVYGVLKSGDLESGAEGEILRWLFGANAKSHYSTSTETTLDSDLSILFRGGTFADLIVPVKQTYGRLHVEPGELKGRGIRSPLFAMMYLALKYGGARDWKTGLGLSFGHQGTQHYIEYHHIFPKSLLKKAGYEKSEINAISNMAFISGRANRSISNKEPVDYLPKIIDQRGEVALTSQFISLDKNLWKVANYRDFLSNRRERLAKEINDFVDRSCENGSVISESVVDSNGE